MPPNNEMTTAIRMQRKCMALASLAVGIGLACGRTEPPPPSVATPATLKRTTADVLFSLSGSESDLKRGIEMLRVADAAADLAEARKRKDRRLIGMMSYALLVPGVDPTFAHTPPPGYTVITIKGTSDAIASSVQATFQDMLFRYAEEYNKGLLGGGAR